MFLEVKLRKCISHYDGIEIVKMKCDPSQTRLSCINLKNSPSMRMAWQRHRTPTAGAIFPLWSFVFRNTRNTNRQCRRISWITTGRLSKGWMKFHLWMHFIIRKHGNVPKVNIKYVYQYYSILRFISFILISN